MKKKNKTNPENWSKETEEAFKRLSAVVKLMGGKKLRKKDVLVYNGKGK